MTKLQEDFKEYVEKEYGTKVNFVPSSNPDTFKKIFYKKEKKDMEKIDKILVIVDMQNDFVTGSLGSEEAKAIVPEAVKKYKKYMKDPDAYVIFTRDTHGVDYLNTNEGKKLPDEHCIKDTKGWEIIPEFRKVASDPNKLLILNKESFGSNLLATYVRGIIGNAYMGDYEDYTTFDKVIVPKVEIELIGLCTDICVVSNALLLKAAYPENKITVDARCCAGTIPEAHEAALKVLESCQIDVIK